MTSRFVFGPEFAHAIRIRGLTLTEVAHRAGVVVATAASAARGHPVNMTTAVRLSRVVAAAPVIAELEAWARSPDPRPETGATGGADEPEARGAGVTGRPRRRSRPHSRMAGDCQGRRSRGSTQPAGEEVVEPGVGPKGARRADTGGTLRHGR